MMSQTDRTEKTVVCAKCGDILSEKEANTPPLGSRYRHDESLCTSCYMEEEEEVKSYKSSWD